MELERFDRIIDALAASGACGRAIGLVADHPEVRDIYADLVEAQPALAPCVEGLLRAHAMLVSCFERGGTLLLCGNGGSFADALHISGELLKSFERDRRLDEAASRRLAQVPGGEALAGRLEHGFPAVVLGANPSLATAAANDSGEGDIGFAQECFALGRQGDVLMAISTSGSSPNVLAAATVAAAGGLTVIALSGRGGGDLARLADALIVPPATTTKAIQEQHAVLYHALCAGVEAHFYPRPRPHR